MKKKIQVILTFIIILNLSACSLNDEKSKTTHEQISEIGESIITGLQNKDKDALVALFSKNIDKRYNLEKEIEESFAFFDSNIIDYNKDIFGSAGGGRSTPEEGWVEREGGGWIEEIKTQSGTTYTISYKVCLLDKEDEDNVGVTGIRIVNEDMRDSDEYIPPEGKCTIGDMS